MDPASAAIDSKYEFDAPQWYNFQAVLESGCSPAHNIDAWFATQGPSGDQRQTS